MLSFSSSHLAQHHQQPLFRRVASIPSDFQTYRPTNTARIISNQRQVSLSSNSQSAERYSLSKLSPLEAILFDIDGTLCDSDPLHFESFRVKLQEAGFNNGVPITEEFFIENISGWNNGPLGIALFPDWDHEKREAFMDDKEIMFQRLASEQLEPVSGLKKLCKWIEDRGLKRGAVTNAPRSNAEHLISIVGLSDFFETLVIASECERAKPFPDPYLQGLKNLNASPNHTFIFEDSPSGIKAGVAAGMPVLGITTRNPEHLLMGAGATFLIKDFNDPRLWEELEALEIRSAKATVGSKIGAI